MWRTFFRALKISNGSCIPRSLRHLRRACFVRATCTGTRHYRFFRRVLRTFPQELRVSGYAVKSSNAHCGLIRLLGSSVFQDEAIGYKGGEKLFPYTCSPPLATLSLVLGDTFLHLASLILLFIIALSALLQTTLH